MIKRKTPQYLNKPLQFMWFESDEVLVGVFFYIVNLNFLGGWFWLSLILGPAAYRQIKKKKPRGYLKHLLYSWGIASFTHYPSSFEQIFYE